MIKKAIGLVLLMQLSVPPLFADYDRFKTEADAYKPPGNFIQKGQMPSEETPSAVVKEPVQAQIIDPLKQRYADLDNIDETINVLMGMDAEQFKKAVETASHTQTLETRVGKTAVLSELQAYALLRHPGIEAARKKVMAELQSFDQVANLDDSLRQYSAFTDALNNKVGPVKGKESVKMAFPSPGISALKGRVVDAQVGIYLEQEAIVKRQVLRDITSAYWDLLYTEQSTRIIQETISAFQRLKDVATVLYKSGKTSFQDVIKINIKLEELKENLITLKSKRFVIQNRLLELLNLPPDTRIGRAVQADLPPKAPAIKALYPMAREHRQELLALGFKITKVSAMVEMSETMLGARYSLGLSMADTNFINTTGTGAQTSAFPERTMAAMKNNSPVQAWYGVSQPWLEQTRQTLLSLKEALKAKENETDRMVRNAWFKTDKNRREFILYKNRILDLSKSALDVSTKEYESGAIPFSQAIDSYTYWLKVKLLIAEKRSRFAKAFADLENVVGKKSIEHLKDRPMKIKSFLLTIIITALITGILVWFAAGPGTAPSASSGDGKTTESANDGPKERKIIYWKAPMDPTEIYDEPGQSKMGMDLVPVYEDEVNDIGSDSGDRKIVYWKAPMDPTEIYDEPGQSKMGMDLVPVYEDELVGGVDIKISPVMEQNMGLKVEAVEKGDLSHTIKTYGHVTVDETRTGIISQKYSGWIETLYVDYTGFEVEKGQPLFDIYSPALLASQEEYLSAYKNYKRSPSPLNKEMLTSAKKRLQYFDIADPEIALIEKTGSAQKTLTVRSPFNGVVTHKNVTQGAYVKTGANLYTIADLNAVWVEAHIFEYEQSRVYVGQPVEMRLSYNPNTVYTGKIAYIFPYLQPKTRDVIIRISFDNPKGELKPDMFAQIKIKTSSDDKGFSIPAQAVIHSGEEQIVFVARGSGKFSPRKISTGLFLENGRVQVLSGLAQGENVVVSGQFLLDSESKLKEAIQKMIESKNKGPAKAGETPTPDEDNFFDDMDNGSDDDFFKDME